MPAMETWADVQHELSRSMDPDWQQRMDDVMYHARLTPREKEAARLLLRGYTWKHIALEMGISRNTLHRHMRDVYRKLGVDSGLRCALALVGIRPED